MCIYAYKFIIFKLTNLLYFMIMKNYNKKKLRGDISTQWLNEIVNDRIESEWVVVMVIWYYNTKRQNKRELCTHPGTLLSKSSFLTFDLFISFILFFSFSLPPSSILRHNTSTPFDTSYVTHDMNFYNLRTCIHIIFWWLCTNKLLFIESQVGENFSHHTNTLTFIYDL